MGRSKAVIVAVVFFSTPIANAAITVEDLRISDLYSQQAIGALQACDVEFPSEEIEPLIAEIDRAMQNLLRVSGFESDNLEEIQARKIELAKRIALNGIRYLPPAERSNSAQWCAAQLVDGKEVLAFIRQKSRISAKKQKRPVNSR